MTNDSAWICFRKDWTFLHLAATISRSQSLWQHPNKPDRCSLRYNSYSVCRCTVRPATRLSCYSWIEDATQKHRVVYESWGQMPTSVSQMVVVYKMHLLFMCVFFFFKEGFFLLGKAYQRNRIVICSQGCTHSHTSCSYSRKTQLLVCCAVSFAFGHRSECSVGSAMPWLLLAFFCTWDQSLAYCEP